uniref:Putative secreted peptide n=1 Tax=Anopheles braziliensis TaxID=58242 RepID=A0A2M3ZTY5_9DIPT
MSHLIAKLSLTVATRSAAAAAAASNLTRENMILHIPSLSTHLRDAGYCIIIIRVRTILKLATNDHQPFPPCARCSRASEPLVAGKM